MLLGAAAMGLVLATGCSRERGPKWPKQSAIWPKYDNRVRLALRGKMHRAYAVKEQEARLEAFRSGAKTVWQMMGSPALSKAEESRLVQVFVMAKHAEILLSNWYSANREGGGATRESLPARCARYVKEYQELDEWIDKEVAEGEIPMLPLVEAAVAETDRRVAYWLRRLERSAETKAMRPSYDYDFAPWQQSGSTGNVLREMVLLYALMSRPDSQLDEHLDVLSTKLGLQLDRVDAGCALARAGKVDKAKQVLRKVLQARPRNPASVAVRQRIALSFRESVNKDTAVAVEVLDDMVARAKGRARVIAIAGAGECYEGMREYARAVANYRKAYEEQPSTVAGFDAALKAAELEAFKLDSPESAAEALEEAMGNAPGDQWTAAQLLILRIYARLKRTDDMAEVCKKLAVDDSESKTSAATLLAAGSELYKAGANDEALTLLSEHLALFQEHGKEPQARLLTALVLLNQWENAQAREQLKAVLALSPEEDLAARAQFLMGYSHLVVQEYADAIEEFDSLVSTYPDTRWAKTAEKQYLPGLRRFKADGERGEKGTR